MSEEPGRYGSSIRRFGNIIVFPKPYLLRTYSPAPPYWVDGVIVNYCPVYSLCEYRRKLGR